MEQRCDVVNGGVGVVGMRKSDGGSVDGPAVALTSTYAANSFVNANTLGFTPANIAATLRVRAVCYGSTAATAYQLQVARVNFTYTTPPTPPITDTPDPLLLCEA
jgi:hypothetical protein